MQIESDPTAIHPMQSDQSVDPEAARYKLTIAYDGTNFHGWQKQWKNTAPRDGVPVKLEDREPLRTVAGVVEGAIQRVLRQTIRLVGASRTDAGVHASGQVAHFDARPRIPVDRLAQAINSRLPANVEVLSARMVPAGFDAISDAVSKRYVYRIFNSSRRPLGIRHEVWHCWTPLNPQSMNDAARRIIGTHDFAGFASARHGRASTIRTVLDCHVRHVHPEIRIYAEGTGFLYNMVRIIAGTLVEVGRGCFDANVVDRVLETTERRLAGPTLPPTGLCLQWIRYPESIDGPGERRPSVAHTDESD